jgi:choline dehydrogenase
MKNLSPEKTMESFDYIIIGAGSAGCVLANRLTQDGKYSVCLLEAGSTDWHPLIHIPVGFIKLMDNKSLDWGYSTEPGEGSGGRSIIQTRGKVLGGSSSINGNVYTRGHCDDFNHWAQRGNSGWGYDDILPYFKRAERRIGEGDDHYRGREGPLAVTDTDWKHPLCEAFIEGAVSLGIPRNKDYNGASQEGVTYTQRTINNGLRVSAADAFLNPVKKRKNLKIRTRAHVTSLVIEDKQVKGVRYVRGARPNSPGRQSTEIRANREVIMAAGVFNSPQMLQLAGIGSADLLRPLGVDVILDLPGVGENLRDHFAPRFTAKVKNTYSINQRAQGPRLIGEAAKWLFQRKGVLTLCSTLVYAFWRSDPAITNSDVQVTFTPASYQMGRQAVLDNFPGMSFTAWQQRPESTGHVRLTSSDPFAKPLIQPNYLAHETDRRVLLAGMKLARKIMLSAPMAPYYDGEIFPGSQAQSDEELMSAARERGTTTFHSMGTCRMGPATDPSAVVDDQLRVHGLKGLRVVDASIMPTMPSANLNAAVIMIAEKASDMILGKTPLPAVQSE